MEWIGKGFFDPNAHRVEVSRRVMKRANALSAKCKALGIQKVPPGFFLEYSWKLEKGFVWTK